MNIYLAGQNGRRWCIEEYLKTKNLKDNKKFIDISILESFAYVDEYIEKMIPFLENFLLDSGAFTYMNGSDSSKINWYEYIERYADFINKNKVEKFIEVDIDSIVGYEKVKELRKLLIQKTNKLPIPVWHKSRGKDEFIKMAEEFPYIALGGIAIKTIKRTEYKFFPWFIDIAHKNNTKIHGLGLTNMEAIKKYKFDSVDSSSWTCGNRFGMVYKFTGDGIKQYPKPDGMRLKNPKDIAINNFNEWVKFQHWAKFNL